MAEAGRYREGWADLLRRLAPEIAVDPVADALRKVAEQVFREQDAEIGRLRDLVSQHELDELAHRSAEEVADGFREQAEETFKRHEELMRRLADG